MGAVARDIAKFIEKIAPPELAYEGEETGFIRGDGEKEVKALGVTWRPTVKVLKEAVDRKIDMLIIHEPLLQSKKAFIINPKFLKYPPNKIRESLLNEGKLSVYRAHSNWDDAEEGNNVTLARTLGLKIVDKIPYGRTGEIKPLSLGKFVEVVKKKLDCPHVLLVGDENLKIKKVAVVSGSGNSLTDVIEFIKQKGADVLVSGDIQDSRARFANELGLAVIDAGGYYTETPGMKHLAKLLESQFRNIKILYLDPGPPWRMI